MIEINVTGEQEMNLSLTYFDIIEPTNRSFEVSKSTLIRDSLKSDKPLYARLFVDNDPYYLYLKPGKPLVLKINQMDSNLLEVNIAGDLARINKYLISISKTQQSVNWGKTDFFSHDQYSFLNLLDSLNTVFEKFRIKYQSKSGKDHFWTIEPGRIEMQNYVAKDGYMMLRGNGFAKPWTTDSLFSLFRPPLNILINRLELLPLEEYRYKLYNTSQLHFGSKVYKINQERKRQNLNPINRHKLLFQFFIDSLNNQEVKNYLLFQTAYDGLKYSGVEELYEPIEIVYENCKDSLMVEYLKNKVAELSMLIKGSPAPEFKGCDLTGDTIKLSDFKGSYVMVDVWATWCGPCRVTFPSLRKLFDRYENDKLVLIMYSIDDDIIQWENFLLKNPLPGIHVIGEDGKNSRLLRDYRFTGVPKQLLIDPEGKIITVNLKRPRELLRNNYLDQFFKE